VTLFGIMDAPDGFGSQDIVITYNRYIDIARE
jgi:hypothetical protein